jgi:hypothetical protein
VRREDDAAAQLAVDLPGGSALLEEAGPPRFRHVGQVGVGVDALARHLEGLEVQVGGEDLELRQRQPLREQHGQRVGLLPGRAPGHPHPELPRLPARHQLPVDRGGERLPHLRVAEELGDVDEQLARERRRLRGVELQPPLVFFDGGHRQQRHAVGDAPQHRGALVAAEVDAADRVEPPLDEVQGLVVGLENAPRRQPRGLHLEQRLAHGLGRQHPVDQPGGDGGQGHAVEARRGGVLHEGEAPGLLHLLEAQAPVAPGAGEHDGHRALAVVLGQRGEEQVDGQVRALAAPLAEAQPPTVELDVGVRRHRRHRALEQLLPVSRLGHRHRRVPREQLRHQALVVGRQVLHHDERRPQLRGNRGEEALQRLEPACRRTDADDQRICTHETAPPRETPAASRLSGKPYTPRKTEFAFDDGQLVLGSTRTNCARNSSN